MYGSTPLEDIINYNVIMRSLTEWTSTNQICTMDQTSVAEGIGGIVPTTINNKVFSYATGAGDNANPTNFPTVALENPAGYTQLVNVRQSFIQGISKEAAPSFGAVPNTYTRSGGNAGWKCTRRYQITLGTGIFTQEKLIPTKFMASQFAVELTLARPESCIFSVKESNFADSVSGSGDTPTYDVSNVNLIPEILEFDSSYDAMFLKGLREGGVPIKFSSWHTYAFTTSGTNMNISIQERSRSVKALFAVQRRATDIISSDSGALFFDTGADASGGTLQNYQWRIGGRYFPASPVQCNLSDSPNICNGGAEAYVELSKALNIVGDSRLSTGVNANKWALPFKRISAGDNPSQSIALQEGDYSGSIIGYQANGCPDIINPVYPASGNVGSSCFTMAIDLETSNGNFYFDKRYGNLRFEC